MPMFTYQRNCQCLSYIKVSLPYEKVEYSSAWLGICDGAMGSMFLVELHFASNQW